jgi:hypothetical protein
MTKHISKILVLTASLLAGFLSAAHSQLLTDLSRQIEIPNIKNINSSETHLYALSESEGLVVFRAYSDSLQWLYSSTGMQERGHILESDIRFAYLYGNTRRLTVIEPTSVLGVYSSTILPAQPRSVKRIGLQLFIAMGQNGLGTISLETPETVDSEVEFINNEANVMDLATDHRRTLYVLKNNNEIAIYHVNEDSYEKQDQVSIDRPLERLFLSENELTGTDQSGNVFLINSDGNTRTIAQVSGSVERLAIWNDKLIVRTADHELWAGPMNSDLQLWKSGARSGNYFAISEDNLWVSEYNSLAPVIDRGDSAAGISTGGPGASGFSLSPVRDVVLPVTRPLILPIEFEGDVDFSQVTFSYSAPFNNARIRGRTFYWQPSSNQTGQHSVTITATTADGQSDETSFNVDLRSFNAPPRFTPSRPVTVAVGEEIELEITATDPDGRDQELIRYLGVDLPNGSVIDEQTGLLVWTPNVRQVGEHQFQVIATDQYGAAASQNFTINVIEIDEEYPDEDDIFDSE